MKKRLLAMFLAVAMCMGLAIPSLAVDSEFEMDGTVLKKYNGAGGAVAIPDGVTTIGQNAFWFCTGLTSVAIPNSVTKIEHDAFRDCTSLSSVTIPNNVTTIEEGAFGHCPALTSVTIPSSITVIESRMFTDCTGLTDLTIPNSVTTIGQNAFAGCTGLTSVTIPDSVTLIKSGAFSSCTGLTSVSIGKGVTKIESAAFSWSGLTSVTIPSGVTEIEKSMFRDCESLTSVTIHAGVTRIWDEAFFNCTAFTDVYYGGSEAQWKAITVDNYEDSNAPLFAATIHYNSTMPDQPTTPTQPSTNLPTVEPIPAAGTAYARTQTVKLDGKNMEFQCYAVKDANGNESNYVKVRDLANALNGTKAQFDVGWDQASKTISIIPNTAYKVSGGEGTTPYTGDQPYTSVSDTPVSFNGSAVKLTSFQITDGTGKGYTYYKLRDLGQLLDFNVGWSAEKGLFVETDKPYNPND